MNSKWLFLHYNIIRCDMTHYLNSNLNGTVFITLWIRLTKCKSMQMVNVFCPHRFFCFWFPLCSLSLPVQDPICQPDGEDRALSHHLSRWNEGGEWRPPHHLVSTVSPLSLTLHHIYAPCTQSLTHAICSWALSWLRRAAGTHGNNSSPCMKENYKWGWWSK